MTSPKTVNTLFMGSDAIALPLLDFLWGDNPGGIHLCGIVTQPDRQSGRGMKLVKNPVKRWAEKQGIPVYQPVKCGDDIFNLILKEVIALSIVMAYGQILPKRVIEAPRLKTLNLHASLLPRYRGPSPIHSAIANGDERTGVSLMGIVPKMDAGPVADAEEIPIEITDQGPDIIEKISQACVPLLARSLPELTAGRLVFREQDPDEILYCRIISREDAALDFQRPVRDLHDHIRAFQPWPGAQFPFEKQWIKIGRTEWLPAYDNALLPGTVVRDESVPFGIACGEGMLKVSQMQRPGGKMMEVDSFLRGFDIPAGVVLESCTMKPLVQRVPFRRKNPSAQS